MQLSKEILGETLVVTVLDERIDAAVALQFKEAIRQATELPSPRVVLNLINVKFVDSSGLGAIVGSMKQLDSERSFELSGLTGAVEKVFHLTRMDTIFTIHASLDEAIDA